MQGCTCLGLGSTAVATPGAAVEAGAPYVLQVLRDDQAPAPGEGRPGSGDGISSGGRAPHSAPSARHGSPARPTRARARQGVRWLATAAPPPPARPQEAEKRNKKLYLFCGAHGNQKANAAVLVGIFQVGLACVSPP
jgi:hypothetical protein